MSAPSFVFDKSNPKNFSGRRPLKQPGSVSTGCSALRRREVSAKYCIPTYHCFRYLYILLSEIRHCIIILDSTSTMRKRSRPIIHSTMIAFLLLCLVFLLVWIISVYATTLKYMDEVRPTIETLSSYPNSSEDSPVVNEMNENRKLNIDALDNNDRTLHTVSFTFIAIFICLLLQAIHMIHLGCAGPSSSVSRYCWNTRPQPGMPQVRGTVFRCCWNWNRQFEEIKAMEGWKSWKNESAESDP